MSPAAAPMPADGEDSPRLLRSHPPCARHDRRTRGDGAAGEAGVLSAAPASPHTSVITRRLRSGDHRAPAGDLAVARDGVAGQREIGQPRQPGHDGSFPRFARVRGRGGVRVEGRHLSSHEAGSREDPVDVRRVEPPSQAGLSGSSSGGGRHREVRRRVARGFRGHRRGVAMAADRMSGRSADTTRPIPK